MSFHTATLCSTCEPPVIALSTGYGSRCPRCGQSEEGSQDPIATLNDSDLARKVIAETSVFRSDGDARLIVELAQRLLDRAERKL